jgi:aquaporin Z
METFKSHLPEYSMEAALLGLFMVSAGVVTILFEYPNSPLHQAIASADVRRWLIGVAMGSTAIALVYSPWGKQSGAHMNPAVTLTFYWMRFSTFFSMPRRLGRRLRGRAAL